MMKKSSKRDLIEARLPALKRGSALIITLFVVVLLTVVVLAFLNRAFFQRKVSFSSGGMVRAELLAKTSVDVIRGDLLDEIQAGSTLITYGSATTPTFRFFQATVPGNTVPNPNVISTPPAPLGSFIKMSARNVAFWSQTAGVTSYSVNGPVRASNIGSATSSVNGRSIQTTRWNKPMLAGTSWPSTVQAPDWIYINRQGAANAASNNIAAATPSAWADSSPTNTQRVVGRYAYTIYDVSGLIDINAAGSLSTDVSMQQQGYKQSLASADLSILTNLDPNFNPTALINWRKASGAIAYSTYLALQPGNALQAASPQYSWGYGIDGGFMKVFPGYQGFANRQDLLNYAAAYPRVIPASQLPNLTVFTRAVDAPSYIPPALSYTTTCLGQPAGIAGTYPTALSGVNPPMPGVRYASGGGGTRVPGGPVGTGFGPVFFQRFPLSRIALLSPTQTATSLKFIKQYFGLQPVTGAEANNTAVWKYIDGIAYTDPYSGDPKYTFNTPAECAALGRAPDFFETIAAGIENDSLGSASCGGWSRLFSCTYDRDKFLHVLQIGANIIDQYDSDSWPMCIQFPTCVENTNGGSGAIGTIVENISEVNGVENIPYLNTVYWKLYRPVQANPYQDLLKAYYEFELWNPHKNASTYTYTASTGPTNFRIIALNGLNLYFDANAVGAQTTVPPATSNPPVTIKGQTITLSTTQSTYTHFSEPTVLTSALCTDTDSNGIVNDGTDSAGNPKIFSGFFIGSNFAPDNRITPTDPLAQYSYPIAGTLHGSGGTNAQNPDEDSGDSSGNFTTWQPVFSYQYKDSGGIWHALYTSHEQNPQSVPSDDQDNSVAGGSNSGVSFTNFWFGDGGYLGGKLDPRTRRFGMVQKNGNIQNTTPPRLFSNDPSIANTLFQGWTLPRAYLYTQNGNGFIQGISNGINPGDERALTDNVTGPHNLSYESNDGILRRADGDFLNGIKPNLPPTVAGKTVMGRPIMLNRPFFNVAELGYVDRDEPWKTLDFWSANTADAGLLDLFSIDETDVTSATRLKTKEGLPVAAGRLNPNTLNAAALGTMLSGTIMDELNPTTSGITQAEATTIANAWVAWNTANAAAGTPVVNRGDYVKFLGSTQLQTALASLSPAVPALQFEKTNKESISRSIANVSNTRTWNVMIDVVAQSGRIATGGTDLSQFVVEGERRYWVHLAIDRITGEVVDQIWEPVSE